MALTTRCVNMDLNPQDDNNSSYGITIFIASPFFGEIALPDIPLVFLK
jgi:hypothetical protein